MTRSLAARLTVLFAACATVVFFSAGLALFMVLQEGMTRQVRGELKLRGAWVESIVLRVQSEAQWRLWMAPKLSSMDLERSNTRTWIVSADPAFRYGEARSDATALAEVDGYGVLANPTGGDALMTWARRIPADGDRPAVTVVLAKDPLRFWETLDAFRLALLGLGLAGVPAVALLGYGIARFGLRPLQRLSRQAQALDPNHKEQRLALKPMPAELDDLTASCEPEVRALGLPRACRPDRHALARRGGPQRQPRKVLGAADRPGHPAPADGGHLQGTGR